jgi:hypothetical protein
MLKRNRILLTEARAEWREKGFRSVVRRFGWKLFAVIFTTYLVRDVAIYIVLPWLVTRKLLSE